MTAPSGRTLLQAWRWPKAGLLLLTLGLSLPFLQQAVHIDDRVYLEIADQIRSNPLFPYDYRAVFEGIEVSNTAAHSHLPLTSYYLALIETVVGGEKEWTFHLAFLAFTLLAVWSFHDLAGQFLRFPAVAAALLLVSPGFLVLSHTLMTEVATLAFWLLALARFVPLCRGSGRKLDWVLCAAGLAGAAFSSLLGVGLLLLMAAYWVLEPRRRLPLSRLLALCALPMVIWFFWYLRAYLYYDAFPLARTLAHMDKRGVFDAGLYGLRALSFTLNIGGAVMSPPALWLAWVGGWRFRISLALLYAAAVPFHIWIEGWSGLQSIVFAVFFSSGCVALYVVFASGLSAAWRRLGFGPNSEAGPPPDPASQSDRAFSLWIALWIGGVFFLCLFLYYSGSVRYVLPAAPPLILFWVRRLERRQERHSEQSSDQRPEPRLERDDYFLKNLLWLGFFLTLPYALWAAHSDYRMANAYRDTAKALMREYGAPGRTVWFTAEWGLRYYLEQEGARILQRTSTEPRPGDIILKPRLNPPWVSLLDGPEYCTFLQHRSVDTPLSMRLLDYSSHAGFYSSAWGVLPFGWGGEEDWERVTAFRVDRAYSGPIPQGEKHW